VSSTDAELHCKVLAAVESERSLRGAEIGIAVRSGVVTLSGFVENCEQKRAVERAAAKVSGVKAVALDVRVRTLEWRRRGDMEVAHAVAKLLRRRSISENGMRVRVEHGWVTLEGQVGLYHLKTAAEEELRRVPGVRGVINLINVHTPERVVEIKSRITDALVCVAHCDAEQITVQTSGNKIILSGTVSSWATDWEALNAARCLPGVIAVEDNLNVAA
jgi:osmotically-inducible protein OsmY